MIWEFERHCSHIRVCNSKLRMVTWYLSMTIVVCIHINTQHTLLVTKIQSWAHTDITNTCQNTVELVSAHAQNPWQSIHIGTMIDTNPIMHIQSLMIWSHSYVKPNAPYASRNPYHMQTTCPATMLTTRACALKAWSTSKDDLLSHHKWITFPHTKLQT